MLMTEKSKVRTVRTTLGGVACLVSYTAPGDRFVLAVPVGTVADIPGWCRSNVSRDDQQLMQRALNKAHPDQYEVIEQDGAI